MMSKAGTAGRVASCPTGAIRPNPKNKSVAIKDEKCMYCGNCYTMSPGMQILDAENDGIAILVGGKVSNARSVPSFSRLVIPFLPLYRLLHFADPLSRKPLLWS
jgi:sulfite reductase beta subunit